MKRKFVTKGRSYSFAGLLPKVCSGGSFRGAICAAAPPRLGLEQVRTFAGCSLCLKRANLYYCSLGDSGVAWASMPRSARERLWTGIQRAVEFRLRRAIATMRRTYYISVWKARPSTPPFNTPGARATLKMTKFTGLDEHQPRRSMPSRAPSQVRRCRRLRKGVGTGPM